MSELSLRQAVQAARVSKSTLLRAIHSGQLSAKRSDDSGRGALRIDAAELHRVYPPDRPLRQTTVQTGAVQDQNGSPDAIEWRVRAVSSEAEVKALRELAEQLKADRDAWKDEAGSWKTQAERLLLAAPIVTPAPNQLAVMSPRRSIWSWWRPSRRRCSRLHV